jgi:hypothetical protein
MDPEKADWPTTASKVETISLPRGEKTRDSVEQLGGEEWATAHDALLIVTYKETGHKCRQFGGLRK